MKELTFYLPIALIVISNVFYNICTKSTPQTANPFLSLLVTYVVAGLATGTLLILTGGLEKNIFTSISELNWTSYILGLCVVSLEFGYIMAYRLGWNISVGSVVANITLGIILIPVGILFYKEILTTNHLFGIALCFTGLFFINR